MNWNTTPNGESLQATNNNVAENAKQVDAEYKAKHDALYGKYTAKAENELILSKKLFKSNPEELATFSDGIKNKIVKEEYWYDTYEEAVSVLWESFHISKKEDEVGQEDDVQVRLTILEKEKKIAEYKAKKSLLDNKLELYIAKNSLDDSMKELIKTELSWLSEALDIDERISNAAMLAKIKNGDTVNFANVTSWGNKKVNSESNAEPVRNSELGKIFWNKA